MKIPPNIRTATVTPELDKFLDRVGWTVECHSPLEIRHTASNSFASGRAAILVINSVLQEAREGR